MKQKSKSSTGRTTSYACRISDKESPDVLVSAFGDVETPLRQGVFDPKKDSLRLDSGKVLSSYFKERLGVPHFKLLDKSVFKAPPTGWLTWMYYGRDVTPEEVLVNARWIAENLREYGVDVILIDDGWQADNRDWEGVRNLFPQGMKWLASEITKLGLTPGLWICPHGQDNKSFIEKEGCFISCGTMGGPYSVDPTHPKAKAYMERLIRRLTREWGYGFLKFDGISGGQGYGILQGYRRERQHLADPSVSGDEAFRRFLKMIQDAAGKRVCIAGCGTMDPIVLGLCHGVRTGNDTDADWDNGFMRAVKATMKGYFLHTFGWYSDPDCCLLRPPLSVDMARAWATLYGLTGQMLMFDDRMPDLGPKRVEILKKISPAAGIRPFDLFPSERQKTLFDLKVNRQGRAYDIVGVFNHNQTVQCVARVDFKSLGLHSDRRYHAYDYWNEDYLGVYDVGLFLEVPPAGCRVVTLCEEGDFPALLSTSRHVLQGWPDLEQFGVNRKTGTLRGVSRVIKGEPYTLTFGLPNDGTTTYVLDKAVVSGQPGAVVTQGRGVARVAFTPRTSGKVRWSARFRRVPMPKPIPISSYPYMIGARDIDPWTVEVFWVSFSSPSGYFIKQNGRLIGYTWEPRCRIGGLDNRSRHEFEVGVADLDGRKGQKTNTIAVTVGESLPAELYLSELTWESATTGYLMVRPDKSVGGTSLNTAGRRYRKGIGAHPPSRVVYELKGVFKRLTGAFGIEDQNGISPDKPHHESGQAMFSIRGDGRELLPPTKKVHGEAASPLDVDISGVNSLELLIEHPANVAVNLAPHANWLDMKVGS